MADPNLLDALARQEAADAQKRRSAYERERSEKVASIRNYLQAKESSCREDLLRGLQSMAGKELALQLRLSQPRWTWNDKYSCSRKWYFLPLEIANLSDSFLDCITDCWDLRLHATLEDQGGRNLGHAEYGRHYNADGFSLYRSNGKRIRDRAELIEYLRKLYAPRRGLFGRKSKHGPKHKSEQNAGATARPVVSVILGLTPVSTLMSNAKSLRAGLKVSELTSGCAKAAESALKVAENQLQVCARGGGPGKSTVEAYNLESFIQKYLPECLAGYGQARLNLALIADTQLRQEQTERLNSEFTRQMEALKQLLLRGQTESGSDPLSGVLARTEFYQSKLR